MNKEKIIEQMIMMAKSCEKLGKLAEERGDYTESQCHFSSALSWMQAARLVDGQIDLFKK